MYALKLISLYKINIRNKVNHWIYLSYDKNI